MNKRIKKKKRKQQEALLNLFNFVNGTYEWSSKCSSSLAELSIAVQKFADCSNKTYFYY